MKKLILVIALGLSAIATLPAHAATTSGTFNVNINLTAACKLGAIAPVQFDYTALQGTAATATGGGFTLQCTNGLAAPSLGLTLGTAAGPGTASVTTTDSAVNLQYTITAPTTTAPNGNVQNYSISGTMAADQAGTCGSSAAPCTNASATNRGYTLYVTY